VPDTDEKRAVPDADEKTARPFPRKRADAQRNEQALLDAAAAVFVASGVDAPVRDIAAAAGVGMGTIYRHFPTRADLVIAVYRHQVDACADAGPALLAVSTPYVAMTRWVDLFVDFLVTKHGLAAALQSDKARFETLHAYFLDRLVPVCAQLLDAAAAAGEIRPGMDAYGLMYAIGNLCAGVGGDSRYDARRMVGLLIAGLREKPLATRRLTAAHDGRSGQCGCRQLPQPPVTLAFKRRGLHLRCLSYESGLKWQRSMANLALSFLKSRSRSSRSRAQ